MREERRDSDHDDAAAILNRMLADAERLCRLTDPLLAGQAAQLRGRIAALVDIASPPAALLAAARS
jgi:hypothetical protein